MGGDTRRAVTGPGVACLLVAAALTLLADDPPAAALARNSALPPRPTVALTVGPRLAVTRGTTVVVTAAVLHTGAGGVLRFYDGARLVATKQRAHGQVSGAWVTGGLKTGIHRVHATFSVLAHRAPVASSPVVTIVVIGTPTVVDQTVVVRVPEHRMPKPTTKRVKPPQRVLATSESKGGTGGLAYTGLNALLLLVLAAVLLVSGALLRTSGRERLRRSLRAGAAGSGAGALGLAAVFATGTSAASAPAPEVGIVGTPAPQTAVEWPGGSSPSLGVSGGPDSAQVTPGARITLVADGFRPGERVRMVLDDRFTLPDAVADVFGRLRYPFTVAPGISPGPHTVKLTGTLLHDGVLLVVSAAGDPASGG